MICLLTRGQSKRMAQGKHHETSRIRRIAITMSALAVLATANATSCSSSMSQNTSDASPAETSATTISESPFSAHFEIDQREIVAGNLGRATIVIVNRTGEPIVSTACPANLYTAGLVGNGNEPEGSQLACASFHEIPIGETRLPVQFLTRVEMCSQPPSTRFTQCLSDGTQPTLVPGEYELIAWSLDRSLPVPSPIKVKLIG